MEKTQKKKSGIRIWAVALWLVVWQIASVIIGQDIFLVSPVRVVARLFSLAVTKEFWLSVIFSFIRIVGGFLLAATSGVFLAALAAKYKRVYELIEPLMLVIKSTPVASFIILSLIWISSKNLSVLISFLMVLPLIYTNVYQGIQSTDKALLEMARVFRVKRSRELRYIYLPQTMPFFRSACAVSLGISWKSGIAAEVIGIPSGSIGEKLYEAKIFLATPDLFAWTLVIILLSLLFEKVFLYFLDIGAGRLERM